MSQRNRAEQWQMWDMLLTVSQKFNWIYIIRIISTWFLSLSQFLMYFQANSELSIKPSKDGNRKGKYEPKGYMDDVNTYLILQQPCEAGL